MVTGLPEKVERSPSKCTRRFEAAEYILEKTHVVTVLGSAFGDSGEGYVRICYASKYEQLSEALARLEAAFGKIAR